MISRIFVIVCMIVVLGGCAAATRTSWPNDMWRLEPGKSNSSIIAPLPMYVGIIPPAADLPPAKAAWSGIWSGWACRNKTCDIKLAVREVRADGATIIYSFASPWIGPFMTQVEAEFVGEEVQAYIGKGISVAYRMRTNGYVECLLTQGENWVAGVLSRDK